jgi:UPF0755 protein
MRQVYFLKERIPEDLRWFQKWWWAGAMGAVLIFTIAAFLMLRPASRAGVSARAFEVKNGEGFRAIAAKLSSEHLIRSKLAFEGYALLTGSARHLKPGFYELTPSMSAQNVLGQLVSGITREAKVTIPEGSNVYDIDELLASAGVLPAGEFAKEAIAKNLEGYLFPDTYRFYLKSDTADVFQKFADNFKRQMTPLLPQDAKKARAAIVVASLLEKEVPEMHDRQVVAGIIVKRMDADQALQIDATVCYVKRMAKPEKNCYPVTTLDTQISSPYNTYLHLGLPPGPIGNPGISALQAALSPVESPYWYYLTDPVTKTTIFSKTLTEHEENRTKYLFRPTP